MDQKRSLSIEAHHWLYLYHYYTNYIIIGRLHYSIGSSISLLFYCNRDHLRQSIVHGKEQQYLLRGVFFLNRFWSLCPMFFVLVKYSDCFVFYLSCCPFYLRTLFRDYIFHLIFIEVIGVYFTCFHLFNNNTVSLSLFCCLYFWGLISDLNRNFW